MSPVVVVHTPLGHVDDPPFRGRPADLLLLDSAEALKRRLRRRSGGGCDVTLDLPRGSFLATGTVLAELGSGLLVAARRPERALIVRFSSALDPDELCRQAVTLGHLLGNQHVPIEVAGGEVRIPVTTSEAVVTATVLRLGLEGLELRWADVALAEHHPLGGHGHAHGH